MTQSGEKPTIRSPDDRSSFAPIELVIMGALLVVCFGVVFLGILSYVFGH